MSTARITLYQADPHLSTLVREWQSISRVHETTEANSQQRIIHPAHTSIAKPQIAGFRYKHDRVERDDNMNLNSVYPISPKDTLIPELLKASGQQKLKILDLGAGSAQYTDLLRRKFKNKVQIFSTGISKRAARKARSEQGLAKLHRNDLKWRSIEELKPVPEFELILSSYGELFYSTKPNPENSEIEKEIPEKLHLKLKQVMQKLKDGGIACFGPVKDKQSLKEILQKISEELGFKYALKFFTDGESSFFNRSYQVLIRKNADLNFAKKSFFSF